MAGLGNLDSLYQTFLGQTTNALNQPQAPWQQELMETVNPEKVRRDNIKQALAQASMALATTPGNFLQGLSVAAGTGANSYLQAKQQAEQDRIKANQLVQLAQQKDQDRRLSLLMDAIGVNRNIVSDQAASAEKAYQRDKDARTEARQAKLDDSLISWRESGGRRGDGTYSNDAATQKARNLAARDYNSWLKSFDDGLGKGPSPEEADAKWQDILYRYGLEDDGSMPGDQTVSGGKSDQDVSKTTTASVSQEAPSSSAPKNAKQGGSYRDGQTAINPQTGERLIYRNGQWQPVL